MSEESRAVFLSYASQDAEAARRICEALRAAGIDVWFDQSELVGGDAWDAKIRRQIADCALFVPVISANTQARLEGYFRIEWKLAAQRTHAMAEAKPFLLPVVIDTTRDAEAHVPGEFKLVQWTRLPGGEVSDAFGTRVKRLLEGAAGPVSQGRSEPGGASGADQTPASIEKGATRVRLAPVRFAPMWLAPVCVALAAAAVFGIWKLLKQPPLTGPTNPVAAETKPVAPLSEARKLTARARALVEYVDDASREDFHAADELCQRALQLDSSDGEVWAAQAEISSVGLAMYWDRTAAREAAAAQQAQRAVSLAPDSAYARYVLANYYRLQPATRPEALRIFKALLAVEPLKKLVLRRIGMLYRDDQNWEQALNYLEQANALPGGDVTSVYAEAQIYLGTNRAAEAEAAVDRSLAMRPLAGAQTTKLVILMRRGDLEAARRQVAAITAPRMLEDREAYYCSQLWIWLGQPDRALEILRAFPRDYFESHFTGPKAFLTGMAHLAAKRPEVAHADFQLALQKIEQRLTASPTDPELLRWKAHLLARLGETAEAARVLRTFQPPDERERFARGFTERSLTPVTLALIGREDDAIEALETALHETMSYMPIGAVTLRYDPIWEPLRHNEKFEALCARLEAVQPGNVAASSPGSVAPGDKSIAVLAFANMSPDKDNEYFADGISEELINVLGRVPGMTVKGRASSFYFKGSTATAQEKGRKLGATFLVDGSVRKMGNTVRITAQVIRAATDEVVWSSEPLVREAKDVFAVQEEISGMIAQALALKIGAASAAAKAEVDPEAFRLYVEGRREWNRRVPAGYDRAEQLLTRAIEIAPGFVQAHAALSDVWEVQGEWDNELGPYGQRDGPLARRVYAKVREALALDPNCAEAQASLGLISWNRWRISEAEEALRAAVRINPNYASAHQWLGRILIFEGRLDAALASLKRAAELDPLSPRILDNLAWALQHAGRLEEALSVLDRSLVLQTDSAQANSIKARIFAQQGRRDDAMKLIKAVPSDVSISSHWRAIALSLVGGAEARSALEGVLNDRNAVARFTALLGLGREEEALRTLVPGQIESSRADVLLFDPIYDRVRGDARFTRALAVLGLSEASARAQSWRMAHPPEKPTVQ